MPRKKKEVKKEEKKKVRLIKDALPGQSVPESELGGIDA